MIGVCGAGMSGLALALIARGHVVSGSDSALDAGAPVPVLENLTTAGVKIHRQNGSGVDENCDRVVYSAAIEPDVPDRLEAERLDIPCVTRATLVTEIFNASTGVAIAGTCGKTTVTGMLGWLLDDAGRSPSILVGGRMKNFDSKNFVAGTSDLLVCEADESDGSLIGYFPSVTVVTGIGFDHLPLNELRPDFAALATQTSESLIVNVSCPEAMALAESFPGNVIRYGVGPLADLAASNLRLERFESRYSVRGCSVRLRSPGRHNVENSLAALAAGTALGLDLEQIAESLSNFEGIERRFDVLGTPGNVAVIDDYAHNPEKLRASLETASRTEGRLIAIFQPHGYQPFRFQFDELVPALVESTTVSDLIVLSDVYDSEGTVSEGARSKDLADAVRAQGRNALLSPDRKTLKQQVLDFAKDGDTILVMGARDESLSALAHEIFVALGERVTL